MQFTLYRKNPTTNRLLARYFGWRLKSILPKMSCKGLITGLSLCFLLMYVGSLGAKTENRLKIQTDKKIYSSKENIKVTVTNISNDTVIYLSLAVEQWKNDKWQVIRRDVDCPCRGLCKKAIISLKHNESHEHNWDGKTFDCTHLQSGQFRFIIHGNWSKWLGRQRVFGVSKSIEIK